MIAACGHVFCQQCISSRLADAAQDAEGGSWKRRGFAPANPAAGEPGPAAASRPGEKDIPTFNPPPQPPAIRMLVFAEEELVCRCPRCGTALKQATLFTRAALTRAGLERGLDLEAGVGAALKSEPGRGPASDGDDERWVGVESTKIHKLMEYLETVLGLESDCDVQTGGAFWLAGINALGFRGKGG